MSENKHQKPPSMDRFLARTPMERTLCGAGVPAHFWHPDLSRLRFRTATVRGSKFSPTAVLNGLKGYIKHPPRALPLIAVASKPTDNGALYLAYGVMTKYIESRGSYAAIMDAGEPNYRFDEYPSFIIIHNILNKATDERAQTVRDLVMKFPYAFRIVVLAGVDDPEKWMVTRVGKHPDFVVKVDDFTKNEMATE